MTYPQYERPEQVLVKKVDGGFAKNTLLTTSLHD